MTPEQFTESLVRHMAELAYFRALPNIPSQTLQKALNIWVQDAEHAYIQIPHYWALYVHDGRGPFGTTRGTAMFLVWFRNPANDPRLRGGVTPVRADELRHLTEPEFKKWLKENRAARNNKVAEPMVITRYVKTGVQGAFFFENNRGMAGFREEAGALAQEKFSEYLREELGELMTEITEEPVVCTIFL